LDILKHFSRLDSRRERGDRRQKVGSGGDGGKRVADQRERADGESRVDKEKRRMEDGLDQQRKRGREDKGGVGIERGQDQDGGDKDQDREDRTGGGKRTGWSAECGQRAGQTGESQDQSEKRVESVERARAR
jgi:hypothetical protein